MAKVAEFAIIGSQGIEAAAPPCRRAASPSHRRATIVLWRRMVRAGRRGSTKLSPSQSFYPIFLAAEKWTDRLTNHAILKLATFPDFVFSYVTWIMICVEAYWYLTVHCALVPRFGALDLATYD